MDLKTKYMGLELKNPLVLSASPYSENIDNLCRLEEAGVSAVVMHSLFEEQIRQEAREMEDRLEQGTESFPEALSYFPEPADFKLGPQDYIEQIKKAKKSLSIPVIASINGCTEGGWVDYAKLMQDAGADGIELNVYFLATDTEKSSDEIENTYEIILQGVKNSVSIPVAVKMHPYLTSVAYMAKCLDEAGADGLVLFNRFYQPDIDLELMEVTPNVQWSTPSEMRLPLRWISVLSGKLKTSLAASTGIHEATDAVKMILAGADVTMVCSTLLKNGVLQARKILADMQEWMEAHNYESIAQMKGTMSHQSCANPQALERANYMKVLNSYRA